MFGFKIMINGDFVCTSANDGTTLFRPVLVQRTYFLEKHKIIINM